MTAPAEQVISLEAEAFAAMRRAEGFLKAASTHLDQAANALAAAGLDDHVRQLERHRQYEALYVARISALTKRLGDGS